MNQNELKRAMLQKIKKRDDEILRLKEVIRNQPTYDVIQKELYELRYENMSLKNKQIEEITNGSED